MVDHDCPRPNLAHDEVEYVPVGLTIEEDDLAMRRAVSLAGVELVGIFPLRENSMAGHKEEDPIRFAVFAKVETTGEGRFWERFGDRVRE